MKKFFIILFFVLFLSCTVIYISQNRFMISWWVEDIFQNSMPQKLSNSMYGIMKTLNKNGIMATYPICLELENKMISFDPERTTYIIWKNEKWYFQIVDDDRNVIESRQLHGNLYPLDKLQKNADLTVKNEEEIDEKNVYLIKFYSDAHFKIWTKYEKKNPNPNLIANELTGIYECEFIKNKWYFRGMGIDQKFDEENGIKKNDKDTFFSIESLKKRIINIFH